MEHITSLKNPKVAAWKALKDRKGRRESGCFLVEGRKMVEEALASAFDVETVLVQEGMELPDGLTMPVYELPAHVLAAVCDTKTPQGIAAVVRMKEQSALGKHIVVLDGVQDPGNVGTIIRTADAAGNGLTPSGFPSHTCSPSGRGRHSPAPPSVQAPYPCIPH